jgi:hypothetical protein
MIQTYFYFHEVFLFFSFFSFLFYFIFSFFLFFSFIPSFHFHYFFLSFFFFFWKSFAECNIIYNIKSPKKNIQSPFDTMKYRNLTMAPLGDGALPMRCQEPMIDLLELPSPVLFSYDFFYCSCKPSDN